MEKGETMYTCWACKGNKQCLECHGSGHTYSKRQSREITCPLCDGGGVCNVCHGSGQTTTQTPEEDMKRSGMGHLLDEQGKVDWGKMDNVANRLKERSGSSSGGYGRYSSKSTGESGGFGVGAGAGIGAALGFVIGFVSCWSTMGLNGTPNAGNPFTFAFYGAIGGAILGFLIKQSKKQ